MLGKLSDCDPIGRLEMKHTIEQIHQSWGELAIEVIPLCPELFVTGSWTYGPLSIQRAYSTKIYMVNTLILKWNALKGILETSNFKTCI